MEIKGIKFISCVEDGSGYAAAARKNIIALYKLGIPLTIKTVSFEPARPDLGEDGKIIRSLIDKDIDYNIIFCQLTPEWWAQHKERGKFFAGFTIWETSKLHHSWAKYINDTADLCMVGCDWNVGVFKESGVTVPIVNVPHVMDINEFKDIEPYNISGIDDETYMFYFIGQWCYDEQTRVLTKEGFKYFKDLLYEDEIATLNKENDKLEYHKPDKIVKFRRKDKMLHLNSGGQYDVCVTPDHKMVVKTKYDESWQLKPLNELLAKTTDGKLKVSNIYRSKKNCIWEGQEEEFFYLCNKEDVTIDSKKIRMDDFLEFFGWYLSEGSLEKSTNYYRVVITQLKSEQYKKEIWECIERMGFTPVNHNNKDILFNSKYLYFYLLEFGKCYEKFIPTWLKDLSSDQIKIFLNSLIKGDGSFSKNGSWMKYTTTSKKLAEDVQECLLKVGFSGSISTCDSTKNKYGMIDGRLIKGTRLQYTISVNKHQNEPSLSRARLDEIDYDGYVYCASVKNHTMLVERNGKILFSGNTERKNVLSTIKTYWRTFRRGEDVALVMKTHRSDYSDGEKDVIRTTIRRLKHACPMEGYSYPPIYLVLDMLSDDEMKGLHARGDCYITLDRGEGFGLSTATAGAAGNPVIATNFGGSTEYLKEDNSYLVDFVEVCCHGMPWCMSLNSLVKTESGYIKASSLQEGISVYNKNLKLKNINKVEFRPIKEEEDMYSIKYYSMPDPVELTGQHKLYVVENGIPVNKKVCDINANDYLYVPTPSKLDIFDSKININGIEFEGESLSRLLYLCGLYLAEGYVSKHRTYIGFSFNINEKFTLANKCKTYMDEFFGKHISHIYERDLVDRNGCEIIFYGKELIEFFMSNFGTGSHDKFITNKIKYNFFNIDLIRGYWDGDGHIRKEGYKNKSLNMKRINPECSAETASFFLSTDLRDVLLSLNIVPSLRRSKRTDGRISYIFSISDEEFDTILDVKAKRVKSRYKKKITGGFGVLITKKEIIEDYKDLVCSISVDIDDEFVEDGGSYILNGIASSNSRWYSLDQYWAFPSEKHASQLMRSVYDDQDESIARGKKLQKYIGETLNWKVIGQRIIDGIRSV